jgi:hypothetical protein
MSVFSELYILWLLPRFSSSLWGWLALTRSNHTIAATVFITCLSSLSYIYFGFFTKVLLLPVRMVGPHQVQPHIGRNCLYNRLVFSELNIRCLLPRFSSSLWGWLALTRSRMREKSTGFPFPSIIIGSRLSPPYSNWITW